MKPHQERVIIEKQELDEKITKLKNFIGGDVFFSIPLTEQQSLIRQLSYMNLYSLVLGERILAFKEVDQ